MAPAGNRRGFREEEVETVVLEDSGVAVTPEVAEQNEADQAAVESQSTDVAREPEKYKSVTYVGEQQTLPSQYGTFVKGQAVSLPASVADALAESTDGQGNAVFEVE